MGPPKELAPDRGAWGGLDPALINYYPVLFIKLSDFKQNDLSLMILSTVLFFF